MKVLNNTKMLNNFNIPTQICLAAIGYQLLTTLPAQAVTFNFSGNTNGGQGTAAMTFDGIGTKNLTVNLDNTSSIFLDNGTVGNAPAITGFGFDGVNPLPNLLSWQLQAHDINGNLVTLGGSNVQASKNAKGVWAMDTSLAGVNLDFLPNSGTVLGGIYNPLASQGLAAEPNFFSTATLSMTFDNNFTPDFDTEMSPFVRMQNVGSNVTGSLKMTAAAPEPYHWAGGVLALGLGWKLKQVKKKLKF